MKNEFLFSRRKKLFLNRRRRHHRESSLFSLSGIRVKIRVTRSRFFLLILLRKMERDYKKFVTLSKLLLLLMPYREPR